MVWITVNGKAIDQEQALQILETISNAITQRGDGSVIMKYFCVKSASKL